MKNDNKISLQIDGVFSENNNKMIANGFKRKDFNHDIVIFFCSFSQFDIELGSVFYHISNLDKELINIPCKLKLVDVTQQFGLPFDKVPEGHKTICKFCCLDNKTPKIIGEIPIVNNWYESNDKYLLTVDTI